MSVSVCFTGHRPNKLFGYVRDSYCPLVDRISELLSAIAPSCVVTGGAQGIDQLAFWAARRSGLVNVVYVPFATQASRWRRDGLFGQNQWHTMCSLADEVVVLAESPVDRSDCVRLLHARNHAMVNAVDIVFGVTAERDFEHSSGGTAECLRYAARCGKPLLLLDPFTLEVWRDDAGLL